MIPATPAAAWAWPTFDLIEPSHSGCSAIFSLPYTAHQRARLDWITESSPRTVGFDGIDSHRARRPRWPTPT